MELRVRLRDDPKQEGLIVGFVGDRYGSAAIVLWGTRLTDMQLDDLEVIPPEKIEEDRQFRNSVAALSPKRNPVNAIGGPQTATLRGVR